MNPMRSIRLEKITLNIGAGEPGPKLDKSKTIIEKISGKKAVITSTRKRTTFGGAKGRPIGTKVTVRGSEAEEMLKKLLQAVDNRIMPGQFSAGNFSFGIGEYINIPGIKYDPDVGIMGMDVCVTFTRPGFRVSRKRIRPRKIGKAHKITKEETIEYAQKAFNVITTKEE
jgi:large subunit ribosomal protein L5